MHVLNKKAAFVLIYYMAGGLMNAQQTQIVYLSGTGPDQTVDWEFYCTEGRNAGKWTTIPVPSNWELMGFGTYNYGHDKDASRGKEKGLYRHRFFVPADWKRKAVSIVFEGAMTDAEVKINGKIAGPVHQGGFYRFEYPVEGLLDYGRYNLLEVTVSKHSSNESVNAAERRGDFWIFGGIFRPVYLKIRPERYIEKIAINALADGSFTAEVHVKNGKRGMEVVGRIKTKDSQYTGEEFKTVLQEGQSRVLVSAVIMSPFPWSAESPNLYLFEVNLVEKGETVHAAEENFGFRTVGLRERDGFYLNDEKIKFKGVNRHSFRPGTGRVLSKAQCIEDVMLIKDMNMNAVRNSHYPPDEYFLDACDSLGLYVVDELAGWHHSYDTETGAKLVAEMLESNRNHPCIVLWANGNEGGHNTDLDFLFDSLDIQKRPVCHPWENFRGMDTQHYIHYGYGNGVCFHGHDVFFPTEFLHGLYDGGHGAGLKDYWTAMWDHPLSAGGFLWDFADGAVVRTDKNGELDTDGNHAADGILGPYHEKEASYYAIKEIWSPVFFEPREITDGFDGRFVLENRYSFTNTNQCVFRYTFVRIQDPGAVGETMYRGGYIRSPDIEPGRKGFLVMKLPDGWSTYDVLYIQVEDPQGNLLYTWSWPVKRPDEVADRIMKKEGETPRIVPSADSIIVAEAGGTEFTFSRSTGLLIGIRNTQGRVSFGGGPVLCSGIFDFRGIDAVFEGDDLVLNYRVGEKSSCQRMRWLLHPSGWISLELTYTPPDKNFDMLGVSFSYPETLVIALEWLGGGPYRVWKNRMEGARLNRWKKEYNNTITGASGYVYPEFKGYHANLYWAKLQTKENDFLMATSDENIFLRLFTPDFPDNPFNTAPVFPAGNISFLQAIPPIGTKSQIAASMGPSGNRNMYFDYWKQRPKTMKIHFNFSGAIRENQENDIGPKGS